MQRILSMMTYFVVLTLLLATSVLGQYEHETVATKESWVVPYALVVLCIGLGVYIISKPARRER